jgi:hypothetical protein
MCIIFGTGTVHNKKSQKISEETETLNNPKAMYVELLTNMSATSLNCSANPQPGVLYVVTINNFQPYHQLKFYFLKSKCKNLALLISPLKYI